MKKHEHWGTKIGFLMATAGSAIGLGSMWKFPYITGMNGGGAFVLLYIIFTAVIGVPLFISELIIGRSTSKGAVDAFRDLSGGKKGPWKFVGWVSVITAFIVFSYYSVVAGWTLNYTLLSLNNFTEGRNLLEISRIFDVMYRSADINILWHFVFMVITASIVYSGVRKGIEFWSKILTPALFVLLLVLLMYSITLDGFSDALSFIFGLDLGGLKVSGVLEALGLSFFTLSVGFGILITYGSYMRQDDDIPKTAITVGSISTIISIAAALMIFSIIFTFGLEPQGGVGLVFKTLPVLFAQLKGSVILSTLFFVLLVFTTLTSTVSLLEVLVASLMDVAEISRHRATLIAAIGTFVFGIPSAMAGSGKLFSNWTSIFGMNFFNTISSVADSWLLPISGLMMALYMGWVIDRESVEKHFRQGSSLGWLFKIWFILVRYLVPVAILMIILHGSGVIDFDALLTYN